MVKSTPISLLVVDDEPDMLRGLRRILKRRGIEVIVANSGEEAVEKVQEQTPHGILMDIRMPGIDGVEAYRRIRELAPNAFVIFMTAFTTLTEEAENEGPVAVLSKPLELDTLCSLIEHASINRPVLVVDDDADFLSSLSRTLGMHGFEVHRAGDAATAMAIFEKRPRSLVLLDMKLDNFNGLDVLRVIKHRNPQALVVQMSGLPEMEPEMKQGLSLSSYAHFMKPFDLELLIDTLRAAMRDPTKPD